MLPWHNALSASACPCARVHMSVCVPVCLPDTDNNRLQKENAPLRRGGIRFNEAEDVHQIETKMNPGGGVY